MPMTFALSEQLMVMGTTLNNNLSSAPGFGAALAKGLVTGVMLAGRNPAAPTAALGDIWGYPNIAAGQPIRNIATAGYTLAVISDSVADVYGTGTGAWAIGVAYLDTNYLPHTAIYALNGQTAVTTASSIDGGAGGTVTNCLRNNGIEVVACGTGKQNAGNIYASDSSNTYTAGVPVTTTLVYDCVLIGDNVDASSQYCVPAGYLGMLVQLIPAINDFTATVKYAKLRVNTTTGANGIFLSFDTGGCSSNNNPIPFTPMIMPILQPKTDIRIQCIASAATEVACVNQIVIWPYPLVTA